MADFKKLSAVDAVSTVSDSATVLIEENGVIKRAPKADVTDFKKLSKVEIVKAPAETANVLIEENGVIKKAPKTAVGGAGGSAGAETPDMVIRTSCRPDYGSTETNLSPSNVTIVEGSHNNVLAAIDEGRIPVVIVETFHQNGGAGFWDSVKAAVYAYGGSFTYRYPFRNYLNKYIYIAMAEDGTITSVTESD
jgi:hypothetical protein